VETVASGIIWQAFDYGYPILGTGGTESDPPPHTWRKAVVKWENLQSTETADDQYHSWDILNITSGGPDSTWTAGDYTTVSDHIRSYCTQISPWTASFLRASEIRYYVRAFNPYTEAKPFADSGSPEHIEPLSVVGTGGPNTAPQPCTTVTEITPSRRHWGRSYMPTLGSGSFETNGRMAAAGVDAYANAMGTFGGGMATDDFHLVVPTTVSGGKKPNPGNPTRTLQVVSGFEVDDVSDVIRRRRLRHPVKRTYSGSPLLVAQNQPAADAAP